MKKLKIVKFVRVYWKQSWSQTFISQHKLCFLEYAPRYKFLKHSTQRCKKSAKNGTKLGNILYRWKYHANSANAKGYCKWTPVKTRLINTCTTDADLLVWWNCLGSKVTSLVLYGLLNSARDTGTQIRQLLSHGCEKRRVGRYVMNRQRNEKPTRLLLTL